METAGLALAFLVVGGMGVTIGIYISSQIKYRIRKNIYENNINNFKKSMKEYEQKKRKN